MCFLMAKGIEGGADVSVPGFWRCGSIDLKVTRLVGGSLPPLNKQTEVLTFKAECWWCHIAITSPLSHSLLSQHHTVTVGLASHQLSLWGLQPSRSAASSCPSPSVPLSLLIQTTFYDSCWNFTTSP